RAAATPGRGHQGRAAGVQRPAPGPGDARDAARRAGVRVDVEGVRPAALPDAAPAPGVEARANPGRGVGLRLWRGRQRAGSLYWVFEEEDRGGRRAEADSDGAGGGVRVKGRIMSIRLRLTLLYSVIVALTVIAFGAALYVTQSELTL